MILLTLTQVSCPLFSHIFSVLYPNMFQITYQRLPFISLLYLSQKIIFIFIILFSITSMLLNLPSLLCLCKYKKPDDGLTHHPANLVLCIVALKHCFDSGYLSSLAINRQYIIKSIELLKYRLYHPESVHILHPQCPVAV